MFWDFPSGPVVENLPAIVGDTGLNPGPGRTQMQISPWTDDVVA